MTRIAYEDWNPGDRALAIVAIANQICEEYARQGYDLTLRQLYYQFVARDYLPNNMRSYKMLGNTIDRARRAGLMDWDYIVDRTRNLQGFTTYETPADLITAMADRFHVDLWQDQECRVEVWVEKEALAGVVSRAALSRGVDYFSCRGYVSQSEMHAAAKRHEDYEYGGQDVFVIHLGDHDPSGKDMTRDMQDRLRLFGARTVVNRIALNWDQIDEFNPPPNPAKLTDSRADAYIREFGTSSWELDALNPDTLSNLITSTIDSYLDVPAFNARVREQDRGRDDLATVARQWSTVMQYFGGSAE
jgi:hypothetical protein